MTRWSFVAVAVLAGASSAQAQVERSVEQSGPAHGWTLQDSDRLFLLTGQAATMAPMSFRVGTLDQLQTVQSLGRGSTRRSTASSTPRSTAGLERARATGS